LEEKQQRIYDGQVVQIRQTLNNQSEAEFSQNKLQILAALTRLRQICCDPSLCLENYDGETAKTDACMELIQGAIEGGHRMLVFSQFTSMLDILKERLQKEGIDFFVLTGSTSKEERRELVQKFNEGTVPVFLISLKAGGVGLNLTGADLVIHYDPWWNLAAQNQATDRAHRIGQTKKVTVYKLIAKDTIEEKILKLQEKKRELADQILNGEGTSISTLNREEILDILEGSK
jgi:SNF2 family DNA or RNA helicase